MVLRGFPLTSSDAQALLSQLMNVVDQDELISRVRQLQKIGNEVGYTLPGLPVCWKCTLKHVGQAISFAAEIESYPERIGCVVGELGHAYRECPDKKVAQHIHDAYQHILDEGCIYDLTPILKEVSEGWRENISSDDYPLQDSK